MDELNPLERIEYELTTFIRRAVYLDQSERKIGFLERASYLLLRQLDEFGPSRVKDLADSFKLDISTLSRQAGGLETKGLIERFADPGDGRVRMFKITELGKEKLEADKRLRLERYNEWMDGWSEEERGLFGEFLTRLNRGFVD